MLRDANVHVQQNTPQQKLPYPSKPTKPFTLIVIILLSALLVGIGGDWLRGKDTQSNHISLSSPSPQTMLNTQSSAITDNTTTVIIQDGYFSKVTIPRGYTLIKGEGDYIRYVTNMSGGDGAADRPGLALHLGGKADRPGARHAGLDLKLIDPRLASG